MDSDGLPNQEKEKYREHKNPLAFQLKLENQGILAALASLN